MDDKKLRLKQLAQEILHIAEAEDIEHENHQNEENDDVAEMDQGETPNKKAMAKAALIAKLKKKTPIELE